MKIVKDEHTGQRWVETKRFRFFYPYNQWKGIFDGCNWSTFNLINIEFENARYIGSYEVTLTSACTLVLLGISFHVDYTRPDEKETK